MDLCNLAQPIPVLNACSIVIESEYHSFEFVETLTLKFPFPGYEKEPRLLFNQF